MSVKGKALPPARTLLEAVDRSARQAARTAGQDIAGVVAAQTPRRSGQTAKALKPKVRQNKSGVALSVGAPRGTKHTPGNATIAQVVRWNVRGTGLYRATPGPKRRIRSNKRPPRRMILPGGARRWTVKGQRPNPFVARIGQSAGPKVQRALEQGARDVAVEIARVIR